MPRTAIPITDVLFVTEVDSITWTTADQVNGNMFQNDGATVLLVKNTTAGAITATIVSVPDPQYGRSGDLSVLCPLTTGFSFVPSLPPAAFNQRAADAGNVYVNWSIAGAQIAALRIRNN